MKKSEKGDFAQNRSSMPENSAELAPRGHRVGTEGAQGGNQGIKRGVQRRTEEV